MKESNGNSMKRNNKKGFTLVELIVVLVILAVLAAILVPALLGWIDKARDKQTLLNANLFYKTVQSVAVEQYGYDIAYSSSASGKSTYEAIYNGGNPPLSNPEHKRISDIYNLMDAGSIKEKFKAIAVVNRGIVEQVRFQSLSTGKVWELTATSQWECIGTYDNDSWAMILLDTVSKNDPYNSFDTSRIYWNGN